MGHAARLSRRDHRTLAGSGCRASSGPVTAHHYGGAGRALGLAVSVRSGGAVARNRIRRRLREAAREITWSGVVVLSAGARAVSLDFEELTRHVASAIHAAQERAHKAPVPAAAGAPR